MKKIKIFPIKLNSLVLLIMGLAVFLALSISYLLIKHQVQQNMIDFMQSKVLKEQYNLLAHEIENDFLKIASLTTSTAHQIEQLLNSPEPLSEAELDKKLQEIYIQKPDGSWRSRHTDTTNRMQMFSFHSNHTKPDLLEKRIMVQAKEYFEPYARSISAYVFNTYFTTPHISWDFGSYAWPLALPADIDFTIQPWYYEGDPVHNPDRTHEWTEVYFDAINNEWMISSLFPVYLKDSFVGVVGNDILLDEILSFTDKRSYTAGYHFFMDASGKIITHPEYGLELPNTAKNNDTLHINHLKDTGLNQALEQILEKQQVGSVFSDASQSTFLIHAPIPSLGWKLVYVIDSLQLIDILKDIFKSLAFIYMLIGLFTILIISLFVKKFALTPLMNLLNAMSLVKSGASATTIHQRSNIREMQQVTNSFNQMTASLEKEKTNNTTKSAEILRISNHLRILNNTIPDAVLVLNAEGYIVDSNDSLETLTGYATTEVLNRHFSSLFNNTEIEANIEKALVKESVGEPALFEIIFKTKSGAIKDFLLRSRTLELDHQKQTMLVLTDISKTKGIEKALKAAKEKAENSDRLKSAFLSNMSHEIRTPLNGIVGFAQLVANESLAEDEKKQFIKIIDQSSQQLLNIIGDILDISKIETGQVEIFKTQFDLNAFLMQTKDFFMPEFKKKNIALNLTHNSDPSEIFTDKNRLNQVFSNLLTNALKFTSQGYVEFGYEKKHETIEFFVKDSGIGIDQHNIDIIFNRFKQGGISDDNSLGGVGLGLAISKGFVETLGGSIWVESEINKGTSFYFSLPY